MSIYIYTYCIHIYIYCIYIYIYIIYPTERAPSKWFLEGLCGTLWDQDMKRAGLLRNAGVSLSGPVTLSDAAETRDASAEVLETRRVSNIRIYPLVI